MPKADKPVVVALFPEEGVAEAPSHVSVQVLALWNEYSERVNAAAGETIWEGATALTVKRRRRINVATKDYGGLHAMRGYLEKAAQNNFLLKQTKRIDKFKDWKPNFDWFLHEDTIVKFIEHRFKANTMSAEDRKADPAPVNWRARLDAYKRAGFWLASDGPRPEEPGPHKAPADMISEWRTRTNLPSLKPVPVESAEDRLRATLGMYEARGRSEDANRIRLKLAALLGHPQEARQEDAAGRAGERLPGICGPSATSGSPTCLDSSGQQCAGPNRRTMEPVQHLANQPAYERPSDPVVTPGIPRIQRGSDSPPPQRGESSRKNLGGEARGKANQNTARPKPPLTYPADALRLGPHDEEPPAWEGDVPEDDD